MTLPITQVRRPIFIDEELPPKQGVKRFLEEITNNSIDLFRNLHSVPVPAISRFSDSYKTTDRAQAETRAQDIGFERNLINRFYTRKSEEEHVYWILYPTQNREQLEKGKQNIFIFLSLYIFYSYKYGFPGFIFNAIYFTILAQNLFGTAHAHIQVGERTKLDSGSTLTKKFNPITGKYNYRPHLAIRINVTKAELKSLYSSLSKKLTRGTCSEKALSYLESNLKNFSVPYPIRLSPVNSTIFLLTKKLWDPRIGNVTMRSSNPSFWQCITVEVCYEFLLANVAIPALLLASVILYQNEFKS
ncbi:MAG TPA: hypothetical protein VJK48_02415 [Chlamydiales bacterium]|nr:hypothetical protein [Chlamydiales bacterium]